MAVPRFRRALILIAAFLALLAAARAELPTGLVFLIAGVSIVLSIRAWWHCPGQHRLERIEDGRIRVRTDSGRILHGALQPDYCSGFYCAFTVHDPVAGSQRFGLFRDELDRDAWRRLRVALRFGGRN